VNEIQDFRQIGNEQIFATGSGIRKIASLRKNYGNGRWRKGKGTA
jgi:hypothetical protein